MIRRYTALKPSSGTRIPSDVRERVLRRDGYRCVGIALGFPSHPRPEFTYRLELDHVRASHGMGMKSRSTEDNLVSLCAGCHRWRTEHGREARPLLLAYLEEVR